MFMPSRGHRFPGRRQGGRRSVSAIGGGSLAEDGSPDQVPRPDDGGSPPGGEGLRDISGGRLVELPIEQELKDSYLTNAMSVIGRASCRERVCHNV